MDASSKRIFRGISRNIVAISLVSFLNDISSEMVYPVVPIFLVTALNTPVTVVGLIEGIAGSPGLLWFLFPLYGVYMALTEGIGKAYISLHARGEFAGTTYGVYQTVTGLAAFPASLAAGFLWKHAGPGMPFFFGAAMAFIALIVFGLGGEEAVEKA